MWEMVILLTERGLKCDPLSKITWGKKEYIKKK